MARYVLHPGTIFTPEGRPQFITGTMLAALYGLTTQNWVVAKPLHQRVFGWRSYPDDIHLFPRADGDYRLPLSLIPEPA